MSQQDKIVTVVGGGLAGTECAFQLAERGIHVRLLEQKPLRRTPAQVSDWLAELVCSNSFRAAGLHNAVGLLKEEMRRAGSLIIGVADETRVPAGGALAVDREAFGAEITRRIGSHPRIERIATEVTRIPDERPVVLATGPLTGDALAKDLAEVVGAEHLAYYDAIAPVIAADSIDESKVFRASRWGKGGDDAYINCPLDAEQYKAFVAAVIGAEKVAPREFEDVRYFEGCLPLEVMAERGERTLAFGPMKPVGLTDPRTGRWPHAVVQLRQEDAAATAYNMVGFQTRMKWPEQKRVFAMIPGLENLELVRYGTVHRNTFVQAPTVLDDELALLARPGVHLAGQITGVEGYLESAACGFVVGVLLATKMLEGRAVMPPRETALGSLFAHVRTPSPDFQPSNIVWNHFLPVPVPEGRKKLGKQERHEIMANRALAALDGYLMRIGRAPVARPEAIAVS